MCENITDQKDLWSKSQIKIFAIARHGNDQHFIYNSSFFLIPKCTTEKQSSAYNELYKWLCLCTAVMKFLI